MSNADFQSGPELNPEDHMEIKRLTERARALSADSPNTLSRRGFMGATSSVLAFVVPAIATFTVSPDALGTVGSGGGMGGMGMGGMGMGGMGPGGMGMGMGMM